MFILPRRDSYILFTARSPQNQLSIPSLLFVYIPKPKPHENSLAAPSCICQPSWKPGNHRQRLEEFVQINAKHELSYEPPKKIALNNYRTITYRFVVNLHGIFRVTKTVLSIRIGVRHFGGDSTGEMRIGCRRMVRGDGRHSWCVRSAPVLISVLFTSGNVRKLSDLRSGRASQASGARVFRRDAQVGLNGEFNKCHCNKLFQTDVMWDPMKVKGWV